MMLLYLQPEAVFKIPGMAYLPSYFCNQPSAKSVPMFIEQLFSVSCFQIPAKMCAAPKHPWEESRSHVLYRFFLFFFFQLVSFMLKRAIQFCKDLVSFLGSSGYPIWYQKFTSNKGWFAGHWRKWDAQHWDRKWTDCEATAPSGIVGGPRINQHKLV